MTIAAKTGTADNIRQRYWLVSGMHKLDALTRILEAEPFDGMIIFARTKLGTEELAGKLQARGFSAAAINGDIDQQQRERTIQQLKDGKIDILVATDVAARGLDVERISHVINYDVPYDTESYIHRIGRTGRAGRSGEAILFITPREKGLLRAIERATRQPVAPMTLPTIEAVNDVRIARFKDQITDTLAAGGLDMYPLADRGLRARAATCRRWKSPPRWPAWRAATCRCCWKSRAASRSRNASPAKTGRRASSGRSASNAASDRPRRVPNARNAANVLPTPAWHATASKSARMHGVKPGNIVGAIANEAGIDGKYIGRIDIHDDHTLLDMPDGMPEDIISKLKGVRISGRQLHLSRVGEQVASASARGAGTGARKQRHAPSGLRLPQPVNQRHALSEPNVPSARRAPKHRNATPRPARNASPRATSAWSATASRWAARMA